MLGGFVAGEGSFHVTRRGLFAGTSDPRLRFAFVVSVASRDRPLLAALQSFLGYGSIHDQPARKQGWLPTSSYTVASLKAHHAATIPFSERFLDRRSAKWRDFRTWREALEEYEKRRPIRRGRSTCAEPDCSEPVRGRGLCRRHYYRVTGY